MRGAFQFVFPPEGGFHRSFPHQLGTSHLKVVCMSGHHFKPLTRFQADIFMLIAALIWGGGFIAQRVAAGSIGFFAFNFMKFGLAVPVMLALIRFKPDFKWANLRWGIIAGAFLFLGSAFQQAGMKTTTAGNAAFITGFYVVLVPLMLSIGWKQRTRTLNWVAAFVAFAGIALLSTGGEFAPKIGDLLNLAGAFMWAAHIITMGAAVKHMPVFQFAFLQALMCALFNLVASLFFDFSTLAALQPIIWTVLYSGILSAAVGFTFQAIGQKTAPPTDASLILCMESVFSAIAGAIFLMERFTPLQILGCALILGALLVVQLKGNLEERKASLSQST